MLRTCINLLHEGRSMQFPILNKYALTFFVNKPYNWFEIRKVSQIDTENIQTKCLKLWCDCKYVVFFWVLNKSYHGAPTPHTSYRCGKNLHFLSFRYPNNEQWRLNWKTELLKVCRIWLTCVIKHFNKHTQTNQIKKETDRLIIWINKLHKKINTYFIRFRFILTNMKQPYRVSWIWHGLSIFFSYKVVIFM